MSTKTKNLLLLFSHQLTEYQIEDAKRSLGIENFIYLPKDLQEQFSNVPEELVSLIGYSEPFKNFIKEHANKGDYILIQGDFGIVYSLINYAKLLKLIPIYATTKREVIEEKKGNTMIKKSKFKHILFRTYE